MYIFGYNKVTYVIIQNKNGNCENGKSFRSMDHSKLLSQVK